MTLPFSVRAVAVDDRHPDTVAAMYGPVMLTAVDPPERLAAASSALARMTRVAGGPLELDCAAEGGTVRMRPFYRVQREVYSTSFERIRGV